MILAFLIAITVWLLSFFLPWWSVFLPGLIVGAALGRSGGHSFLGGFAGIAGLWLVQTMIIDIQNDDILIERIAGLFSLPSSWLMFLITVIIGGLIGGLTTLTGCLFRNAFID